MIQPVVGAVKDGFVHVQSASASGWVKMVFPSSPASAVQPRLPPP